MLKTGRLKLKIFGVFFLLLIIVIASTSCVCPLFSFFERMTGFDIKVGEDIDQSIVTDDLIYPDSVALIQVEGDIEKIVELIGQYGVNLSEKELAVMDELPQEIKEQQVKATVFSTADKSAKVMDYYYSLSDKGWNIQEMESSQQAGVPGQQKIMVASKDDIMQAFMLVGTDKNTIIIFIDFDWDILSNMSE
jgi:hypothetical protein